MAETSLHDISGRPTAYIADDGESVYLWTGQAAAWISGEKLYRWSGQHIGWFVDDIVYDQNGHRAGFTRRRLPVVAYAEAAKYAKYARPARGARHAAHARPALSLTQSSTALSDLLKG